jgi:hypothetical protein
MASPRHNPFCARCGITYVLHAMPESSCPKYIAPGSREARELSCDAKVMGTGSACVLAKGHAGRHETSRGVAFGNSELPTKAEVGAPIDSSMLDRALMEATILDLEDRRRRAIQATQACLSAARAGAPRTASRYAERALKALGGLGAS